MTIFARARRLVVLGTALLLAIPMAVDAFTVNDPIAIVSEDREAAARLHQSLQRRFRNIVVYDSLAAARARFEADGDLEIAILLTSSRDRSTATAYGASLPTCHVTVTAEILRLPAAKLEISRSAGGKGPDCGAALAAADARLADQVIRSLEEYRRHGAPEVRDFLWLELADAWSDAELASLRAQLLKIPGIRGIDPNSESRILKVEVYRDARALAREMDQLAAVRVTRISGNRATLGLVTSSAVADQVPLQPIGGAPANPSLVPASGTSSLPLAEIPHTRGRKWALVVGVSSFYDQAIPRLAFPDRDAESFATVLKDPGVGRFASGDVVLLLNNDATTRRIKKELDDLARKTQPGDLFVFFFSSHASSGQHDTAGDAYLVTHDTEISNLYATGLPMRELVDALSQRIRARTVVSFLDACHTGQIVQRSGGIFTGAKAVNGPPSAAPRLSWTQEWKALSKPATGRKSPSSQPTDAKKLVFISSSDGAQPSWESEQLGHGYFTYFLMEALTKSQGQITVGALFDFLKVEVKQAALAERGVLQEPRMFFNQDANIRVGYSVD